MVDQVGLVTASQEEAGPSRWLYRVLGPRATEHAAGYEGMRATLRL